MLNNRERKTARTIFIALVALVAASAGTLAQEPASPVPSLLSSRAAWPPAAARPADAARAAASGTHSQWDVYFYPVLAWVPIMGIDITVPEPPPCTGCPPSEPSDSATSGLNGAAFVDLRLERGRFGGEFTFNYAGLAVENKSPFLRVETGALAGAVYGGVRVWNKLYVEGGARYQGLDIRVRVLDWDEVRWKPGEWQPIVGSTFHPSLGKHWNLYAHIDGSFGSGLIKTVNGSARAEWRPLSALILSAGYGFTTLKVNEKIGDAVFDAHYTLHGPIIGLGIKL